MTCPECTATVPDDSWLCSCGYEFEVKPRHVSKRCIISIPDPHHKLVQAIGTAILLGAWIADWSAAKRQDQARQSFQEENSHNMLGLELSHIENEIRLEASIQRALKDNSLDRENPFETGRIAWEYAEVRKIWTQSFESDTYAVASNLINFERFCGSEHIEMPKSVENTWNELNSIRDELCHNLDPSKSGPPLRLKNPASDATEIQIGYGTLVADNKKISWPQAQTLRQRLDQCYTETIEEKAQIMKIVTKRQLGYTNLYRFLFAIGSILVCASYLIEWKRS